MKSTAIRQGFLDFFKKHGHTVVPSSSLIPQGDPTLLFTSAGMVPLKPYFLGLKKDLSRVASSQKCVRTTDIDRVGETVRHLTFFEMLGNFSFGDYFKEEAIDWCWTFLTKELGVDPKVLHVSVYKDDDEAQKLWAKHTLANPIVRLGEDTNFWTMGPTGPCGPCSEVYVDRGPEHGCGKPSCRVGCDCDRYFEVWNNVFTQFDKQEDGSLKPLPRKNIDTGMGLERITMVVQGKDSPFLTDLFFPIMEKAGAHLGALPGRHKKIFRVLGDHSRAAAFLVAEGVVPSNEGRGYVLRRLIRRALSHGAKLQKTPGAFIHQLAAVAADEFGGIYPELKRHRADILATIKAEEDSFLATLQGGEATLKTLIGRGKVSGEEAFDLYQTYGFPFELTRERLKEAGIEVDEAGFAKAQDTHREASHAFKGYQKQSDFDYEALLPKTGKSEFVGYDKTDAEVRVLAVNPRGEFVDVVLDKTPFYPEGGGQVGDRGVIEGDGFWAKVVDTLQPVKGLIVHRCKDVRGPKEQGPFKGQARVDREHRRRSMCHHTGTHLLNAALRRVLGTSVRQAGSYVGPDRLRFDYTIGRAPTKDELEKIESIVNGAVHSDHKVCPMERPAGDVEKFGATILVGENYGEKPRFVWIGPECWDTAKGSFSLELCGGTHVEHTGEIELFKILRDSSVSAGVRRIEAVAGPAAVEYFRGVEKRLADLAAKLGVPVDGLESKLDSLLKAEKDLKNEIGTLRARLAKGGTASAPVKVKLENGGQLWYQSLEGQDMKRLRTLADDAKLEIKSGIVVIESDGAFVVAVTEDYVKKGFSAGKTAGAFAEKFGGKAGGRPDFAQGGVKDNDAESHMHFLYETLRAS